MTNKNLDMKSYKLKWLIDDPEKKMVTKIHETNIYHEFNAFSGRTFAK